MKDSSSKKGLVVSDLHLFSRRSEGEQLFEELKPRIHDTDTLVLNGDIFDFRWSHLPSEAATIQASIDWLQTLIEDHPQTEIHYLLGNHDCLSEFHEAVESLSGGSSQLHLHTRRLQLGDSLFLHGDCANWLMDHAGLERFRDTWSRDRQRGPMAAKAYDVMDFTGVTQRFYRWYFREHRAVRRVAHHLDHVVPDWSERVSHCYFGHTHSPFRDFAWKGVRFSNTGSGIRGAGFQPLEFHWKPATSPN